MIESLTYENNVIFFNRLNPQELELLLGNANLTAKQILKTKVSKVEVHPTYNQSSIGCGYDIALLKTEYPIYYRRNIAPLCLPPEDWEKVQLRELKLVLYIT